MTASGRHDWILPLLLAGLALALFLPRLGTPGTYVFDELYYAYTAGRYVAGDPGAYATAVLPRDDPAIEWTHPPLAKLAIAGGILLLGDGPLGWRAASVLFGAAGILVAFALGRELTGSAAIGAVAAGLLLADGLFFVESRLGMSNIVYAVLANGALLAFARALNAPPATTWRPLLATGLLLGLAGATKWSAVALAGAIGLGLCWRGFGLWRAHPRPDGDPAAADRSPALLRWLPLVLVAVPAAVYLAAYLHFFLIGLGWADLLDLHRAMLAYHRGVGAPHPDASAWWEWPLAASPIRYFAAEEGGRRLSVIANGNPLLWWPMAVAVAWVAVDWWGRRPAAAAVLLVGFFGQWLPWALSPRGTFAYHFLPAVPLGCVALAVLLVGGWRGGGWRRSVAVGYVLAVAAVFAYAYPLHAAVPLTPEEIDARLWFARWR